MSPNMSTLDRGVRTVVAIAAAATGVAIGPGSATAIVLFAVAAVLLATSAISFCALYALVRFDSRGRRPLPH
jgi:Protein of unknown function (DUF2892)